MAERAAGCRSEGVERACPTFVPQLLWDCPEPQGASGTGLGALPGVLRAVRNLGEPSGTPEWRLLWAQRHFGDKPDRVRPQSAVAKPHGSWPIRAAPVPTKRHRLDRRGDRQGDAHALQLARNPGRFSRFLGQSGEPTRGFG